MTTALQNLNGLLTALSTPTAAAKIAAFLTSSLYGGKLVTSTTSIVIRLTSAVAMYEGAAKSASPPDDTAWNGSALEATQLDGWMRATEGSCVTSVRSG